MVSLERTGDRCPECGARLNASLRDGGPPERGVGWLRRGRGTGTLRQLVFIVLVFVVALVGTVALYLAVTGLFP